MNILAEKKLKPKNMKMMRACGTKGFQVVMHVPCAKTQTEFNDKCTEMNMYMASIVKSNVCHFKCFYEAKVLWLLRHR